MKFVDTARVTVVAGNGGDGAISWHREKYLPKGGPDGGDGGTGGAVVLVAEQNVNTLVDFSMKPIIRAPHGASGEGTAKTGRDGADTLCLVPVGTQVFYNETLVADRRLRKLV